MDLVSYLSYSNAINDYYSLYFKFIVLFCFVVVFFNNLCFNNNKQNRVLLIAAANVLYLFINGFLQYKKGSSSDRLYIITCYLVVVLLCKLARLMVTISGLVLWKYES